MSEPLKLAAAAKRARFQANPVEPAKKKFCSWCVATLSGSRFGKMLSSPDGLRPYCRRCESSRAKEYRERNPEKVRAWAQNRKTKSYAENREYYLNRSLRSYAIRKALPGSHTREEIEKLKERQGHRCATCFCVPKKWHRDHIVPASKGGSHNIDNIQMLCAPCNLSKGTMDNDAFLKKLAAMGGSVPSRNK